jgi:hypothetical protein
MLAIMTLGVIGVQFVSEGHCGHVIDVFTARLPYIDQCEAEDAEEDHERDHGIDPDARDRIHVVFDELQHRPLVGVVDPRYPQGCSPSWWVRIIIPFIARQPCYLL